MRVPTLNPVEQRVLGCLIEKQRTTPDAYPLSLNALRLACNQATNRNPVVEYDEHAVREAAQRLSKAGLARLASGAGSRAVKYRQLAGEALELGDGELALVCVLLLRGPQTPGELKGRTERLARFDSPASVEAGLDGLAERGFVERLGRMPGQKEERFRHLMDDDRAEHEDGERSDAGDLPARSESDDIRERLAALEAEVAVLRHALTELQGAAGGLT